MDTAPLDPYLAASRMEFAYFANGKVTQHSTPPIEKFETWANDPFSRQCSFWPDHIELGRAFYESLCEHAVPLDPRALRALQNSALALDTYSWLAHRLCRVRKKGGTKLSWRNLKEQFGHEYKTSKDFKREFKRALLKVRAVYPTAKIDEVPGGLVLHSSPAPIKRTNVLVQLP
jgi:hypothetical protein